VRRERKMKQQADKPHEMTLQQIESRLYEIHIEFMSYEGDEEYDLSELQDEKDE
jgi:hypothetical protein